MLNQRALLFLGVAVLLGLAAAFVAQRWLESLVPEKPASVAMASLVVARVDLPVASPLDPRELETVAWPRLYLPRGAITDVSVLHDRVLSRPLLAGEPVLHSSLLEKGAEAGLTGVISPDRRAVSVKVDSVVGVAGFVKPGAHVDVLATLRRVDQSRALPYSKVILQSVRVLAVDQKLEQAHDQDPELVNVVTLEVEPEQAEKLTYSAHEGRLQLALRNPTDEKIVVTKRVGVADLLGRDGVEARPRSAGARTRVELIEGSKVKVKSF